MGRTWILDTETKGTGANMVPLETIEQEPEGAPGPARRSAVRRRDGASKPSTASARRARRNPKQASSLPPGHVRKKATGEIGKVRSVDSKAGTASVHWLRHGLTSTVSLSAISRR